MSLTCRLISKRAILGMGDVLFTLAMGISMTASASLILVCLAFLLALPLALVMALCRPREAIYPSSPSWL